MQLTYKLSFPEPHTHYLQVEMHITGITSSELLLKMAVWTPGSYLIREYQKNIDFVESVNKHKITTRLEKKDKNTWAINTNNENEITIRYKTYCYEYSVRTNFIDETHALLNGAPTFLYLEGNENIESEIHIEPFKEWKNISTSLPEKDGNKWIRIAKNIDELIDSPMEIGNHDSFYFDVDGVAHELAVYGSSNGDMQKLIKDLEAVIKEEIRIFGSHPCSRYVFILHHTDAMFGGLEHLHSSVNFVTRWSYEPKKYQQVISLLAHEYFHLWNVKRIRPITLGPFNYSNENYTDLLWFFEGITSYYDDYICFRAGVTSEKDYLDIVVKNINSVVNTAGLDTQTLAEASIDAWIKYYRKNENTNNTQVSYYTKGAIIGLLFDFIIIDATGGEKCLDDVMKGLYSKYTSNTATGITETNLLSIFNDISGIDLAPLFQQFIHVTGLPDLPAYFELMGIELKNTTDPAYFFLGLGTDWKDGKLLITELDKNYGAYEGGLNVQDEIIAIDDFRVMKDFWKIYGHKKPGETIDMIISRQGTIKRCNITLSTDKRKNFALSFSRNISTRQTVNLKKWL
jgi:predicted metalloprotease with PDZ domain